MKFIWLSDAGLLRILMLIYSTPLRTFQSQKLSSLLLAGAAKGQEAQLFPSEQRQREQGAAVPLQQPPVGGAGGRGAGAGGQGAQVRGRGARAQGLVAAVAGPLGVCQQAQGGRERRAESVRQGGDDQGER